MTSPRLLLVTALALSALATGCEGDANGFRFDSGWGGGDLQNQTYAVGSTADVVVWGPAGFNMNATRLRVGPEQDRIAEVTIPRNDFELECVVGEVRVTREGEGRVGLGMLGGGAAIAWSRMRTAEVEDVALTRTGAYGSAIIEDVTQQMVLVEGGRTQVQATPLSAEGERLAGRLQTAIAGPVSTEQLWDNSFMLEANASGPVEVTLGNHEAVIDLVVVPSQDIVGIEIVEVEARTWEEVDGGGMVDIAMPASGDRMLAVVGLTEDGTQVGGLEANWVIDGDLWDTAEAMGVWGDFGGEACWGGHCAAF